MSIKDDKTDKNEASKQAIINQRKEKTREVVTIDKRISTLQMTLLYVLNNNRNTVTYSPLSFTIYSRDTLYYLISGSIPFVLSTRIEFLCTRTHVLLPHTCFGS